MKADLQISVDQIADATGFSGVVQVSRGGELLCESTGGLADRAHEIRNTPSTRFGIASGTKGFTAVTIMSLVAEKVLALDTSVRSVLGNELELIDSDVSVGHLLAHTSGIGDYLEQAAFGDIDEFVLPVPVHRLAKTTTMSPCCAIIRRSSRRVIDSSTATAVSSSWRSWQNS